jgi:hypothetical protein
VAGLKPRLMHVVLSALRGCRPQGLLLPETRSVGNILMKLGIRDRVHAVVLAYETGLIRPGDDHVT